MKQVFSNFFRVVTHFKSSAIINIFGLSAALTVCFIVLMQVYFHLTFDRGYPECENIVEFSIDENGNVERDINCQIPALIKEKVPEIEAYCMFVYWGTYKFDVEKPNGVFETHAISHLRTTPGFLKVFSPEIVMGDTTGLFLPSSKKAMISLKTAKRIFGDENPIGKTILTHYGQEATTISAVYQDFPENSSLANGLYGTLPEYNASEWGFKAYFYVKKENLPVVNQKINQPELTKIMEDGWQKQDAHREYKLTKLNRLYLHYSSQKGGSKHINTVYTLLAIGILTLTIAFVNFINLSLAMAPSRVRGLNIRKVLGLSKSSLRFTIAMENVFFTCIAILLGFICIHLLKESPIAKEVFADHSSLSDHFGLLAVSSAAILFLSFCIGLYTSHYTTSFDEADALKGSFALSRRGTKLRNVLIVLQFATAITLISVSTLIKQQHDYMLRYDWGMPKDNIVYMPLAGLQGNSASFGQELLRDPRITDYCITRHLPGRVGMAWGRNYKGKQIRDLFVWSVDERFFDFFEVEIIAGRKPEYMDSVTSQLVMNETFLREYGFDESLVGEDFPAFGSGRIQAIAKDVNFQSLHEPIVPMAFGVLSRWQNFVHFLVKLSGTDVYGAIEHIENKWKEFSSEPFEVHFLDEEMDRLYEKENNMAKLIGLLGIIIVVIAVMGVYGLIVFNTRYKRKEIGIRKVNGASTLEMIFMLNRNLLILLGIAFFIALPISWYIIDKWLEQFAYKIAIPWWLFPGAGLVILLISAVAVSWQSYKAATTNPVEVLKNE